MLRLDKVIKPWKESAALNDHINLYGFWSETAFLTKSGDVGMILSIPGVDYESSDRSEQEYAVKRLEAALKAFGPGFHVYQYLFKSNRPDIPFAKYDDPIVEAAIDQRRKFFEAKRDHEGLDCVILFIPHDGMYHAAIRDEVELIRDATEKRVFVSNPMTLIPLLKAVSYVLDQEKLNRSAEEISKVGADLYGEVTRFATNMSTIGDRLKSTVRAYNEAIPGLDKIARLRHRDLQIFPALEAVRLNAQRLSEGAASTNISTAVEADIQKIQHGDHAYCCLLTLITQGTELQDDEWQRCYDRIALDLGKGIATAASRGKLTIGDELPERQPTARKVNEPRSEGQTSEPLSVKPASQIATSSEVGTISDLQASAEREIASTVPPLPHEPVLTRQHPNESQPEGQTSEPLSVKPASQIATSSEVSTISDLQTSAEPVVASNVPPLSHEPVLTKQRPMEESLPIGSAVAVCVHETNELTFEEHENSQALASAILAGGEAAAPALYTKLLWRLIYEEKEALAFHLAACTEQMFEDRSLHVESAILRSVVLARHMRTNDGIIAHELKRSLDSISLSDTFHPGDFGWNRAMRFLLTSASLGPALLGSTTNAANVLRALYFKDGLDNLWQVGNRITEYSANFRELDLSALEVARDESEWKSGIDALSQKVEAWWAHAKGIQFTYGPARQVWWRWLEDGQLVHSILAPIRGKSKNGVEPLKAEIQRLCDDGAMRSAIDRTDREVRNRGSAITATAFGQLKRHLQDEVLEFARQWLKLQSRCPSARNDFHYVQTRQLRTFILERREVVDNELDQFDRDHGNSLPTRAGIACCRRNLRRFYSLLAEQNEGAEPDIKYLLHSDLLRVKGLSLGETWEPEETTPSTLAVAILGTITNQRLNWFDSLRDRLMEDDRDYESATRIVEFVSVTDPNNGDLEGMRSYNNRHLSQFQEALRRDIETTRSCVENAVAFDLLKESERTKFIGVLEPLQRSVETVGRFGESAGRLKQIRDDIEAKRQIALNGVRSRLATSSKITRDSDAWRRIESVLETGDIYTANEYLEFAEAGDPLPLMGERRDSFREFFPETAAALERYIGDIPPTTIVGNLKQRLPFCGRSLEGVEDSHLGNACAMAEAWFTAKRQQRLGEDAAMLILRSIGLPAVTVQNVPTNVRNRTWLHVQSEILADRERCPVFVFGSQANGRYRVLCLWNSPTHEDILSYAGENPHASPLIIFYFGTMGTEKRRNVARLCRDARRTCLVFDDTLMMFLCSEPGSRLPTFFNCTMPFTYLEPYTITAGTVPPEMFYGRRREIESIVNPHGSCFIYGGRQLGKTALLRAAERKFHDPNAGRVARWLDLKAEGLGFNRSLDEIWPLIANLLKEKDVRILPTGFSAFSDPSRLFGHIRNWLDADRSRRIILLLDEADRFLESDAKENFSRSGRLKNWMDQTGRRFKVVFAGLHNVQRSTRQANNPLAHFGEPICIGPLLEHGEWKEARGLVERPLETIGFRFDSPDLVTRILSQTNYYPSLIQLYCNQLLRFFARRHYASFDPKNSPPYRVESKDVEEAYQSSELRRDIRNRFRWTLDLDPRYRVIALSIAFGVAISRGGSAGDPPDDGFSVSWIRDQAFSFSPKGFQNVSSQDEFMSLLQEMIGLGVLREVKPGFFALRSPNLLTLLGTEDEIASELDAAAKEEPLPAYEPTKFRSGDPTNQLRRSPLTAAQESEIKAEANGVSVIFGSDAAGLSDLRYFLRLAKEDFFVDLDGEAHNHAAFLEGLAALKKREQGGTTVGFVSSLSPWDEAWITAADHRIRELARTRNFLRAAFAADPQTTWMLLRTNSRLTDTLMEKRVTSFSLMPWHEAAIDQWLNDVESAITRDNRTRLLATTGRWPILLYEVAQKARTTMEWEGEIEALESSFSDAGKVDLLRKRFGLNIPEPCTVLQCMADLAGEVSPEEVHVFLEDSLPLPIIQISIVWADLLRFIVPAGNGRWLLDPVVARILKPVAVK